MFEKFPVTDTDIEEVIKCKRGLRLTGGWSLISFTTDLKLNTEDHFRFKAHWMFYNEQKRKLRLCILT